MVAGWEVRIDAEQLGRLEEIAAEQGVDADVLVQQAIQSLIEERSGGPHKGQHSSGVGGGS